VTGRALVVCGNALQLPLPDACVDLIVTSPPYFSLRAYNAGPGELGSEPTPAAFLEALWAATREMVRVLKPSGSIFVNLGDKYKELPSGGRTHHKPQRLGESPGRLDARAGFDSPARPQIREKSLLGLPWAYALGATGMLAALGGPDSGLNLILRAELVWSKPNGLPESVTDRVRRSHESWFHLVKQPRYYSAVDEVRESYSPLSIARRQYATDAGPAGGTNGRSNGPLRSSREPGPETMNPLGKLPGSVWSIPSEPLDLPGYFIFRDGRLLDFLAPGRGGRRPRPNGHHPGLFDPDAYSEVLASGDGPAWRWLRATGINRSPWPQDDSALQLRVAASHYAAFPSRWPEQIIKGWSPPGICVECGDGRVPVVDRKPMEWRESPTIAGRTAPGSSRKPASGTMLAPAEATILGYACACTPYTDHPSTGEGRDYTAPGAGRAKFPFLGGQGEKVGAWREYHLDGWRPPPTRPALIVDPFGGTGTTAMVARALGRHAVSVDLSHAYSRAAKWRVTSDNSAKAISRTNRERQGSLL
jgi:hypothetical protein